MRATVLRMLQAAWGEELVAENRAARTTVPDIEENKKPRAILTDDEIARFVEHPDGDAEIKLLLLLARSIGGMRTGDLNTMDRTAFGPDFATCSERADRDAARRSCRREGAQPIPRRVGHRDGSERCRPTHQSSRCGDHFGRGCAQYPDKTKMAGRETNRFVGAGEGI